MSNQFGFLSDDTFSEKMDTMNQFLAAIATGQGGTLKPASWSDVQALVRNGLASKVFAVGDQLTCQRGSTTLVWDIIGFDIDTPADKQFTHSMTLQLHDCLLSAQYDAPEALFYCETALATGTYNFTLLAGYDTAGGGGKTYQFTLAKEVPAGGQITFPWSWNTQASATKVSTHKSRTDTAAIETVGVTEGTGGTSLGTADGKTTNMNHSQRIRYGSNNWAESAIRQYLNSDKAAGFVWTPQTKFDRPPSWNASTSGFMNGLDADFLAVIGNTTKVTCRNTVTDGVGSDTTKDKFFLLSKREVFAGNDVSNVTEGEPYPFYSDYSDHASANAGADKNRIKYREGSPQLWWLRTPRATDGCFVSRVGTDGNLDVGGAYYEEYGVAPACNVI